MRRVLVTAVVMAVMLTMIITPAAFAQVKTPSDAKGTRYQPEDILGTWVGSFRSDDGQYRYAVEWDVREITNDVFTVNTTLLSGCTEGRMLCKDEFGTFSTDGAINLGTQFSIHAREVWPPYTPTDISWMTHYHNGQMVDTTTIQASVCVNVSYWFILDDTINGSLTLHKLPEGDARAIVDSPDDVKTGPYTGEVTSICNGDGNYLLRTGLQYRCSSWGDAYDLTNFKLIQDCDCVHKGELLWESALALRMLDGRTFIIQLDLSNPKIIFYGVEISFDMEGQWEDDRITDGIYDLTLKFDEVTVPNVDIGEWSASAYAPGPIHQLNPAAK